MKKLLTLITFTCLFNLLVLATPTFAAVVTHNFSGVITSVTLTPNPAGIQVGDTFTGLFGYDTTMLDRDASPDVGWYAPEPPSFPTKFIHMGVTVRGQFYYADSLTSASMVLRNTATNDGLSAGGEVPGILGIVSMNLSDSSGRALSDTTLPTLASEFDMGDWETGVITFGHFPGAGNTGGFGGQIFGTKTKPRLTVFPAVEICWASGIGLSYQVQWSTVASGGSWSNLGGAVAGTGAEICVFDSTRRGTERFYRIQTNP